MTQPDPARLPYRPCVGVMVVNGNGLVFAGQRIDNPADAWQMPQGGIDENEDPAAAALRELREETSIPAEAVTILDQTPDWIAYDLPDRLVPRLWGGRFRGQKQRWFLMRFHGPDSLIDIRTAHPEFRDWTWLEPDRLIDLIVPFKRDTYRQVLARFRPHLRA